MEKLCDLHTHSVYSDGTLTPSEILRLAQDLNLSAVALCDHNTVSGLPDFLKASKNLNIKAVCGAEFSCEFLGKEVHLLGLFIKEEQFDAVTKKVQVLAERKEQSNRQLTRSLRRAGYQIDYDELKSASAGGQVNRANIAAKLTSLGYTKSPDEAFKTLLLEKHGHYLRPRLLDVFEMIEFLTTIGSASVLAHPFLNLSDTELVEFLPRAKKSGLLGLETLYPKFSNAQTERLRALCREFCLLQSGGSDFHGTNKPDISLGVGRGDLAVPYEFLEKLESAT